MADSSAAVSSVGASKLALEGGTPVRRSELPPWPVYSEVEVRAVSEILESGRVNYWTGDECRAFEREYSAYHGTKHAVTLANGTLALELALRVFNVGSGDEVIVTPRSYFASASCIALSGAKPVFADIDRDSQNVTAASLSKKVTSKTKALLVVHLAGWPCDMPAIMDLAESHGIKVIEDCAQSHGARIDGKRVGSFGDAAAFSFCQDKIISTAGEGGMLLMNDSEIWKQAWEFKDHGKSWDQVHAEDHPPGFRWLHESFGSNWRMTEIQAAIGRIQLTKLDDWVKTRRANADRLRDGLEDLPLLRIPRPTSREYHVYYKFYVFVQPDRLKSGWSRDRILAAMRAEGMPGLSGSCPEIYREKAFDGQSHEVLPVARELGETSIMFMVHPTLGQSDIDDMIQITRKVCSAAAR